MAIVLPEQKVLFLHPRKTAGSTVAELLMPYCRVNERRKELPPDTNLWQLRYHPHPFNRMHAHWKDIKDKALPLVQNGWRIYSMIRNPFHRVASFWGIHQRMLDETCYDIGGPHATYLRFEDLENELRRFFEEVGLPPFESLPHRNVREAHHFRPDMDKFFGDGRRKWVLHRHAKDFEIGGYTKW